MLIIKKRLSQAIFLEIIIIFVLLILFSSCNENKEIIYMKKINSNNSILLSNISASSYFENNYIENVLSAKNTGIWLSNSTGKDEIIFLELKEKRYIKKLIISSKKENNLDSFNKVVIYTNRGKINNFNINEAIPINDTIKKIFIKVNSTNNFKLVSAYKDSIAYKLNLQDTNKISINKIIFFGEDNEILPVLVSRRINKKNNTIILPKFIDKKIIDYSNYQKSIIINSDLSFYATKTDDKHDYIYKGEWRVIEKTSQKIVVQLNGQKYIFGNNFYKEENFSDKITFKNNIIESKELGIIYTDLPNDALVEITSMDSTIVLDIKYATKDNFTGIILYDCPKCLIRYGVAKDLIIANKRFKQDGFRIKVFDAYRPNSVQYLMWEAVPNKNYVANPEKGSIHNRGGAVDLTLVDNTGKDVDMGTEFDFFGIEAFSDHIGHSDTVLANRLYMRTILSENNFNGIRTEWWHYSHRTCMLYEILDFPLPCNE